MILRVIRGRASPEQLESLRSALGETLGSAAPGETGPVTYHLGAREGSGGHEVLLVVLWATPEAVTSSDARGRTGLTIATALGLDGLEAFHYEIDAPIRAGGTDAVAALRIARGLCSKHGADIEMLNVLRERVPLLGDEMAEAYVGRRLVGRTVEVAFVSVWRRLPADAPLEVSFWPDVALRYDRLDIEVYPSVGSRLRID